MILTDVSTSDWYGWRGTGHDLGMQYNGRNNGVLGVACPQDGRICAMARSLWITTSLDFHATEFT